MADNLTTGSVMKKLAAVSAVSTGSLGYLSRYEKRRRISVQNSRESVGMVS